MAISDILLLALLGAAYIFSIIELGISAYIVSVWNATFNGSYDIDGYIYTYSYSLPGSIAFLLFCSIWTILVTTVLFALQLHGRRSASPSTFLAPLTLALNAVTMIFWLSGFAALANFYAGFVTYGLTAALLAFAILAWLVFLAILILNILTAMGVMASDRAGYTPVFKKGSQRPHHSTMPMSNV